MSSASEQLRALAVRLRAAGEGAALRQVAGGIRAGAAPLVVAVKASAVERLPKGGGLNEVVAGQRIVVSVRTGANTAGVRLVARQSAGRQANKGAVLHPTFARRGKGQWKPTDVDPGWWTDPLVEGSPLVTPGLIEVMDRVGAEIQGR